MPHRIFREIKVYLIRSPHPHVYKGSPSGHASLLGYLIELFLNYKPSADKGEPGTWVSGQTGKST
jgi:hypothetical protein